VDHSGASCYWRLGNSCMVWCSGTASNNTPQGHLWIGSIGERDRRSYSVQTACLMRRRSAEKSACVEEATEPRSTCKLDRTTPILLVIVARHHHLQISGKFLPTAFERRSQKMTTAPNMKPDSASSEPTKPATGTPPHDAQKTPASQPHTEPKPAQKS